MWKVGKNKMKLLETRTLKWMLLLIVVIAIVTIASIGVGKEETKVENNLEDAENAKQIIEESLVRYKDKFDR